MPTSIQIPDFLNDAFDCDRWLNELHRGLIATVSTHVFGFSYQDDDIDVGKKRYSQRDGLVFS